LYEITFKVIKRPGLNPFSKDFLEKLRVAQLIKGYPILQSPKFNDHDYTIRL